MHKENDVKLIWSSIILHIHYKLMCAVVVVVITAYDFESGRPGSNPEWGLIYY